MKETKERGIRGKVRKSNWKNLVEFSYQERSLSRLPCSMTALANCLKTRSMYVLCRGHRPSRKPIWPPWQVMSMARLGFCFTASTGMAARGTNIQVLCFSHSCPQFTFLEPVTSHCTGNLVRLLGLTMGRGEDIIGSVQTQHRHLHRFQPVDRTGIVVIVVIGRIAKHYGGEPLIEFPNGLCL